MPCTDTWTQGERYTRVAKFSSLIGIDSIATVQSPGQWAHLGLEFPVAIQDMLDVMSTCHYITPPLAKGVHVDSALTRSAGSKVSCWMSSIRFTNCSNQKVEMTRGLIDTRSHLLHSRRMLYQSGQIIDPKKYWLYGRCTEHPPKCTSWIRT